MTTADLLVGGLGPGDRVGVIAGGGMLPLEVARGLAAGGHPPFVIIVRDEAGTREELRAFEHEVLGVGDIVKFVPALRRAGVTHVVMAGGVYRRPKLSDIGWSPALLPLLGRASVALARGDDALLKAAVGYLEDNGFRVVGPHQVVPDLLAGAGALTRARPDADDRKDIAAALEAARAIGRLDIGQAAIAVGGRAVALEGIEGTDGLLERMAAMRGHGQLGGRTGGVLVKCAKPGQEERADLPAVGPATVEGAAAAGLKGIGVEAGRTFILDHGRAISRADELGIFILGFPAGEGA